MKEHFFKLQLTYVFVFFIFLTLFFPEDISAQIFLDITPADAKTDGADGFTELKGARGVTTFYVNDTPYAIVASRSDDGVQIINLSDPTNITPADAKTDDADGFTELEHAYGVTTFSLNNISYAIVGSYIDDGVQIIHLGFTNHDHIQLVPEWIKNNVKWWVENKINDETFFDGLEFLIQNDVLKIQCTSMISTASQIPGWVTNNIKWWSVDVSSEYDFVISIEYLINHGIIKHNCI